MAKSPSPSIALVQMFRLTGLEEVRNKLPSEKIQIYKDMISLLKCEIETIEMENDQRRIDKGSIS